MDVAVALLITFAFTLINGYFSMSEMAVVSAKRSILEPLADEGDAKARQALELQAKSAQFLASIQVAITLVGFASSAFAATSLSSPLARQLVAWIPALDLGTAESISVVVVTILLSYASVVLGELVPKRIALAKAEAVAKAVSGPIEAFMKLARPLVWITSVSASGVAKLAGVHMGDEEERLEVSEDELRFMVEDSDSLSDEEKSMIHDVINLGDTVAREVMVPRVDMCAAEDDINVGDLLALMRKTGYSRIPLYHETIDRMVGIVLIKDIIGAILDEGVEAREQLAKAYARPASFVPDTKDIMPLLSEMQTSHEQMVIVVDEYGGTAGIITVEDIIEEIVGEIEDEFDPDNKYLTQLSENEWLVDGRFSIDDALELGWPIEDSEEYETIAGFVLDQADKLPRPGDIFEHEGWTFAVQSMRGRRVTMLKVTGPEPSEDDTNPDEDSSDSDAVGDKVPPSILSNLDQTSA